MQALKIVFCKSVVTSTGHLIANCGVSLSVIALRLITLRWFIPVKHMSTVKQNLLPFIHMKVAERDIIAMLLSLIFNMTHRIHQKYGHAAQERSNLQYHFHPGIQKPHNSLEKNMAHIPVTISGINFIQLFWSLYQIYSLCMPVIP